VEKPGFHESGHHFSTEPSLDKDKAQKVRQAIAEVVGFELEDIQDADSFIADYSIAYTERKALLERLNAEFGKDTPLGRPGQPAELAPLYVFLAGDESRYISGEIVGVTVGKPLH
jgi:hypothetical protein